MPIFVFPHSNWWLIRLWDMGPNTSHEPYSTRWMPLIICVYTVSFAFHIHGPRNQWHGKTPSRLTSPPPAVSAHPGQTASILWTRGKNGYVTWHHQSTQSLHQRDAQGLETTTRSSLSYLATHPGSRFPTTSPWPQLSMEIHSGSRTLEAPRGNRYAPARGLLVMMMMMILNWCRR